MNIYFGKISGKNPLQYQLGFYETQRPDLFNGIDVGDYAFIIANRKIQLWKAKQWTKANERLDFDIIVSDLGINTKQLTALNFLEISKSFVIMTVRQTNQAAFFKLNQVKTLTEAELTDIKTYQNTGNYRNISVYNSLTSIPPNSEDINLYYDNGILQLNRSTFFNADFFTTFTDNIGKIGGGRPRKDTTLKTIENIKAFPVSFTPDKLSILNLYDAFGVDYGEKEMLDDNFNTIETEEIMNDITKPTPLNQIFFGPPGTGKTYHTIEEAVKIVDLEFYKANSNNRDELQKRFNELLITDWDSTTGQIAFCTFHQSFSYEDFVEGIKPKEIEGKLLYETKPGIFKEICRLANDSYLSIDISKEDLVSLPEKDFNSATFYKISLGDSTKAEDKEIYDYCIANNCISIGFAPGIDFTGQDEATVKQSVETNRLSAYDAQEINIFKNYLKTGDYIVVSNGNLYIRALGKVTGEYRFVSNSEMGFNHFRDVQWIFIDKDIPVGDFYRKKLQQQTIYKLKSDDIIKQFFVKDAKPAIKESEPKNYVIIIDEINRGNVSSIFGELITLIEPTKRKGCKEALELTLPYSKAPFSVPQNVYIIGTMNTADRSIEQLDTALRRRFSFVEIQSECNLLKPSLMLQRLWIKYQNLKWKDAKWIEIEKNFLALTGGVIKKRVEYEALESETVFENLHISFDEIIDFTGLNLSLMLHTINQRIEKLIDKDHMIGHSYFMNIESIEHLENVFKDKVLPLLEEYFYGDFGKIGLVLGDSFIEPVNNNLSFAKFNYGEAKEDLAQRNVYKIKDSVDWNFKNIYEN